MHHSPPQNQPKMPPPPYGQQAPPYGQQAPPMPSQPVVLVQQVAMAPQFVMQMPGGAMAVAAPAPQIPTGYAVVPTFGAPTTVMAQQPPSYRASVAAQPPLNFPSQTRRVAVSPGVVPLADDASAGDTHGEKKERRRPPPSDTVPTEELHDGKSVETPTVSTKGTPAANPTSEAIAHHLRAQTRLRGIVQEVTYTDLAQGLGQGVIRSLDPLCNIPFSCRNISLERGEVKIAHQFDPCTFKLSCRGQELRATSIRLKSRKQTGAVGSPTTVGASGSSLTSTIATSVGGSASPVGISAASTGASTGRSGLEGEAGYSPFSGLTGATIDPSASDSMGQDLSTTFAPTVGDSIATGISAGPPAPRLSMDVTEARQQQQQQ